MYSFFIPKFNQISLKFPNLDTLSDSKIQKNSHHFTVKNRFNCILTSRIIIVICLLGDKLESTQKTCLELHDAVSQLDQQIEDLTREKQKNLSIIIALQNRTKQTEHALQGKYPYLCKNPSNLDSEIETQTQRTQLLFTVMDQLGENFPDSQGELRRVRENMFMRTQVSNFIRETLPTIEK